MGYTYKAVWVIVLAIIGVGNTMAVEEAKYTVVLKEESFEVREYEPHILAETIVEGGFNDAGNQAFKRLFEYISGNNETRQKIEMTSPVGQQEVNGNWTVSFMMPASYTLNTLPKPKNSQIYLRQVPSRFIASIRYSGFWSEKGYTRNRDKLEAWIKENKFNVTGEPIWARYNPPFMPWFLRRNEILVPITSPSKKE